MTMSSEQATLSEATADASPEPSTDWKTEPDDNSQCRGCGGHVTSDFARVYGDDDNVAWACIHCTSRAALRDGAAADPDHDWRVDQ